jgi:hypothetical protein
MKEVGRKEGKGGHGKEGGKEKVAEEGKKEGRKVGRKEGRKKGRKEGNIRVSLVREGRKENVVCMKKGRKEGKGGPCGQRSRRPWQKDS